MGLWKNLKNSVSVSGGSRGKRVPISPSTPTTASVDVSGIPSEGGYQDQGNLPSKPGPAALQRNDSGKQQEKQLRQPSSTAVVVNGPAQHSSNTTSNDRSWESQVQDHDPEKLQRQLEAVSQAFRRQEMELQVVYERLKLALTHRQDAQAEAASLKEKLGKLEIELKTSQVQISALEEARAELSFIETGRVSHLEVRLLQLEGENRELRERLLQREAEMLGEGRDAVQSVCYLQGSSIVSGTRKQADSQARKSVRGHKNSQRGHEATLTPLVARALSSSPTNYYKNPKKSSGVQSSRPRKKGGSRHPETKPAAGEVCGVGVQNPSGSMLFQVKRCCDLWSSPGHQGGWSAAVLAELVQCAGGRGPANKVLGALAGLLDSGQGSGVDEARMALDAYVWNLKCRGVTAALDIRKALPVIEEFSRNASWRAPSQPKAPVSRQRRSLLEEHLGQGAAGDEALSSHEP